MSSNAALVAAKKQLRSVMKSKLAGMSSEVVATQSHTVSETLKSFKPYNDAQRISIFLSMPAAEVQTDAIVRHALSAGKQVFVPYLHKSHFPPEETPPRIMDMVRLRDIKDYESLGRDKWGIPSIDPESVHERQRVLGDDITAASSLSSLDVVLVPGVAFDLEPESGRIRRMGHGKGFYDVFVRRYSERASVSGEKPAMLYGLGLSEQLLPPDAEESIPVAPHDKFLDGLVLGDGSVHWSPEASRTDS